MEEADGTAAPESGVTSLFWEIAKFFGPQPAAKNKTINKFVEFFKIEIRDNKNGD